MIENVGFRNDSTNTKSRRLKGGQITNLGVISDPPEVAVSKVADLLVLRKIHNLVLPTFLNPGINALRRIKLIISLRLRRGK